MNSGEKQGGEKDHVQQKAAKGRKEERKNSEGFTTDSTEKEHGITRTAPTRHRHFKAAFPKSKGDYDLPPWLSVLFQ